MAIDVRPIVADELLGWLQTLRLAFHMDPPGADEANFRLNVIGQDLGRSLAALDNGRVVGTLASFTTDMTLPGGTSLATNAIAAATVMPTHRRRGLLTRMIETDLHA